YSLLYEYHRSFWFNSCFSLCDFASSEFYALSLHDALPISFRGYFFRWKDPLPYHPPSGSPRSFSPPHPECWNRAQNYRYWRLSSDRKSTRLNSSHVKISYAVFCLKKKKNKR